MTASAYSTPDRDQVLAALVRMGGNLQFRRGFYSRLENPKWVEPLDAERAFSNPPSVRTESDGTVRADPWPEIDYLVRMAAFAPEAVAAVFTRVATTDNPWIRRALLDGLSQLPGELSASMATHVAQWGRQPRTDLLDPPHLARYIGRLYADGHPDKARRIVDAFYKPTRNRIERSRGRRSSGFGIDDYWYGRTFPQIAEAMGPERLGDLRKWLEDYQRLSGYCSGKPAYDMSEMWRPSVTPGGGRGYYEAGDALVDAVRSAAVERMQTHAMNAVEQLMESDQPLLHRVALDAAAEILEDRAQSQRDDDPTHLVEAVGALLADPRHAETGVRVEYARLIRACVTSELRIDLSPLWEVIDTGPLVPEERLRDMYGRAVPGRSPEEIEGEVAGFKDHWRHLLLAMIGPDQLPEALTQKLAELDGRYGSIIDPLPKHETEFTYSSPAAPIDLEAMKALSDIELLTRLRNWVADGSGFDAPSYSDQGRVLSQLITADPDRLSTKPDLVRELRPTYIRAIISGWQAAINEGRPVPWSFVADLCEFVSPHDVDLEAVTSFDDDAGFRYAKFEVGRLIDTALSKHSPDSEEPLAAEIVLRFLELLIDVLRREPAPTEAATGTHTDPLSHSLNELAPVLVRGLTRTIAWESPPDIRARSLDTLAATIQDRQTDLSIAAALGEGLARLYLADADWLAQHTAELFGGASSYEGFQQAALSTAFATHRAHSKLLAALREPVLHAIREFGQVEPVLGWRNMRSYEQLIGDWIVHAHIVGNLAADDDLFITFFLRATPTERGDVLGHVAWSMMHADEIDASVMETTKQLFDQRLDHVRSHPEDAPELAEFYWFVTSSKFEIEWWLPRLVYVVTLYRQFEPKGMIGENVAEAADIDPNAALTVVEQLLRNRATDDFSTRYDITEHAAPKVLARALDAGGLLTRRAEAVMNDLGRAGFIDLDERVHQFRQSA